ncbi:MAG: PQQ-binding-like beta-propeller repeat protein, partial [Planctomycetota bacterium]|nr:PQQ-binding-like beta-propeller repeat protein [Planctomycetota bacterium]
RVYLIDRSLAKMDDFHLNPGRLRGAKNAKVKTPQPPGRLVCLDAASGKTVWETDRNIFGTLLALSEEQNVLLMTYQHTRFRLNSELGGRMAAFSADKGKPLWNIEADYMTRPIINNQTIYAQPGAWNLLTGERLPFKFNRSYGCGILAGSRHMLVFRSATLGYFDLDGAKTTVNYGGIRPGCWINAIPAGGLVLMADAASWCQCSYLNQATIALRPVGDTAEKAGKP